MMKSQRLILIITSAMVFFFPALTIADKNQQAILQVIAIKQRQNQTMLTLTLKNTATSNFIELHNPERLVVDLSNTRLSSVLPRAIHQDGLVKQIRVGHGPDNPNNLRLVLDLVKPTDMSYMIDQDAVKAQQNIQIFLIVKPAVETASQTQANQKSLLEKQQLFDQALDLEETKNTVKQMMTTSAQTLTPAPIIKNIKTPINNASFKKAIIVIDPGHGGKDSGASGPDGVKEKNVVLAISKKLTVLLNQQIGIKATLTRKGDYFIPLRGRLRIARKEKADLFMAIHADAFSNDTATGASVFALSPHGATSEAARWLAERENTSELSGITLGNKDHELKSILLDMSQTATISDSLRFAKSLLNSIGKITPLHKGEVEQAGFVVLKSPDIPSVLVETGFISNPEEEDLLSSSDFQERMAQALEDAIVDYFKTNPPPDTWYEMQYKGG